ncbi:MAG: hypothetical protein K2K81_04070 [Muribaculaceae bacterium]|nr:hypothetical protein [Muribaculaceae bacterium]
MNAQELKDALSVSDIITYVTVGLGSDGYTHDNAGNPIFQTIDHNGRGQGKYKLYYYDDRKLFVSYTGDGSMDIFELTIRAGYASDFKSAFNFVADFFGYNPWLDEQEAGSKPELTSDWDLISRLEAIENAQKIHEPLKTIPNSIIEYFPNLQPEVWRQEGISVQAMRKYGIRMDTLGQKIVIPHYDINGKLLGIRGRSYNWIDLERGAKYSPIILGEGKNITMYNHPLGENLYGINFNKTNIQQTRSVILVESEKSVLMGETFFPENNCVLALCGSTITDSQVELVLSLGVNEVILALDKENDNYPGSKLSVDYMSKLKKLAAKFTPYATTYIVRDFNNLLDYKDSPFDKGKEILFQLLEKKWLVPCAIGVK